MFVPRFVLFRIVTIYLQVDTLLAFYESFHYTALPWLPTTQVNIISNTRVLFRLSTDYCLFAFDFERAYAFGAGSV